MTRLSTLHKGSKSVSVQLALFLVPAGGNVPVLRLNCDRPEWLLTSISTSKYLEARMALAACSHTYSLLTNPAYQVMKLSSGMLRSSQLENNNQNLEG